ncbi:MAG: 30S ribosomal protein S20 [Candidatus Buchananbacteria bacterium RIFCSPHIGHO2_01_FULL_39_14]|uniref:Small ribosomal subunit protein bS20 n=2 Tax=Candidatus Buchananiibacteriota TaxID=1817903 RepID=A0A1G1YP29_9BACT|nr:MAG: 30S ribosomal protein S20 [Candidatus Buchananbacteria bacterium RIFCSPHIGHO2_01_FULL_39_14]OGY48828.1 MAG: 30S ribosomal protein S20 [Candidatus Buchananbacteria bacterium RIFCSPHIGHO2_02_FULL_39_17]OGY54113.1 MAG: 30S ribosomal protein S20 [Candidatus Buchananbacteria bacterium RIFCSPLOWO2_01_FULL_40_23b]
MPRKAAALKALRQNRKSFLRHQKVRSDLVALIRRVRKAISLKDEVGAQKWLNEAIKRLDKAVQKGMIKKNTAARRKSRLTRAVNALKK